MSAQAVSATRLEIDGSCPLGLGIANLLDHQVRDDCGGTSRDTCTAMYEDPLPFRNEGMDKLGSLRPEEPPQQV